MYQLPVTIFAGTTIAEKGLSGLLRIDCKRFMFGAVGAQTPTVFVFIDTLQWLVHIPYTAIAIILFVWF